MTNRFFVGVLVGIVTGTWGLGLAPPASFAGPMPVLACDQNPPEEKVVRYILHVGRTSRADPGFTGYELTFVMHAPLVPTTTEPVIWRPELPDDWKAPVYFSAVACNDYDLCSDWSDEIESKVTTPTLRFWLSGIECGDCDGDGDVDGQDLASIATSIGKGNQ